MKSTWESGETNRDTIFVIFLGNMKGLSIEFNIESVKTVINFIATTPGGNYFCHFSGTDEA